MATPVSRVSVLAVFLTVIVLLEISSTYAQQVFTTPGSCNTLGAVNGLTPQPNANSPYVMQIAPQFYTTGTTITVTVYANQPAGRSLREFIIQARDTATNSPVGTFTRVNGNPLPTNEYNVYNCGTTASTVGTTSNNVKSTPVVFTYQAGPASGNIGFRCSFLQDTGILYQSLASQQVVNQANVAGPVINNCPGDIFLPSSQDTMTSRPFVSVEWTEPTSIGVGVNNPVNPNALIQIGSEAVLLTYTFRSGDSSSTCSFNVVVNDDETTTANTAPVLSGCPVGTVNSFTTPPTCNDAEQGGLAVTCNPPAGSPFQAGTTTAVACSCSDNLGSSDVCTFNVFLANPCSGSPCLNGGTCTVFGNTFQCTCVGGFSGNVCQTPPVDPCTNVVCQNGGTCITDGVIFVCICIPTFTGTFCEVPVPNPCSGSPCLNGGTCTVFGNTFQCACVGGFSGNICQTPPVDPCTNVVCQNGGTCITNGVIFICVCIPTFSGTFCEVPANPCSASPCLNGGTCTVFGNTFQCTCVGGFSGNVCQTPINTSPTFQSCPDVTANAPPGSGSTDVSYTLPFCLDTQDIFLISTCNPLSGTTFPVGSTDVTCVCTDSGSLSTSCTFQVQVNSPNSEPELSGCPVGTVNSFTIPPTCNDAEQGTLAVTCNPPAGSTFQAGTTTVVTCFCSDNLGLSDGCIFSVVNSPPQIGPCPTDFRSIALNNQFFLQFTRPSCTDPDGDEVNVTCNPAANSFVANFPSDVNCTCTDSSQATDSVDTCPFDTEPPTIVVCPSDQVVTVLTGSLGGVVNFPTPQAQDNSGFVVLANNPQFYSGFYFPLGMTTVTYEFRDAVPLTVTCTFTITVNTASPCDSSPCFNGGVCLAVDNSRFWCVCPGCFIGDTCSFSQDPCTNNNQCLNGGQCRVYPGSCTQTFCECQPCFTGANCQISSNPCDNNQCGNGGVCVPSTTNCDSYTCFCSGCQAGPFCQGVFDPCSRFPCLNGGACTNIAESCTSYSCQCTGCFTGYNCQTVIPDPCVTLPCLNGGICTRVAGTCLGYTCNCQTGFGGVLCENNVAVVNNPCNTFPCMNDGCCVSLGNNNYKCICRNGYTGILCGEITSDVIINRDSCRNNPCTNGGTCYNSYNSDTNNIVFVPQYTCACQPGFVGQNCQLPVAAVPQFDICTSTGVVCLNGGTCRNTYCSATNDLGVFCECPAGFLGERCQIQDVNRCSSSPCRNGGQCTAFSKFFACSCVQGFGGTTCEVTGADNQAPVISNCPTQGVTVTANAGDDFAFVTWPDLIVNDNSGHVNLISSNGAPGNYPVGSRNVRYVYADANGQSATCSFVVTVNEANFNPCNSSPCQNNAVCSVSGDSFQCTCAGGFTGATCTVPLDLCTNVVCQNGGTCFTNGVIFACQCLATFTGTFCEVPVNNPCSGSPCQNGGTCTVFGNNFQCTCVGGFTGTNCQTPPVNPCTNVVCQNGGTCITDGVIFICVCLPTFTGTFCEVPVNNPCSGSPCQNGGTCTAFVNTFQCSCVAGFSGTNCQTPAFNPCNPISPCQNNAFCSVNGNTFRCTCVGGFTGPTCTVPPNPCSGSPCLNGGTCTVFVNTFQCTCDGGFTGNICQTPNPCVGSPCLNGGTCTVFGDTFQCTCDGGFTGNICQTPVTQTFAECPGQVTETQVGNGDRRVSFANPVCPAGQVSSCTPANNALVTSTNPVDVCCTCSSGQSQSQCCFARVFDPQSPQSFFVTSVSFPDPYPQGMTYNTVVTSTVNLEATLLFFMVPPPDNNLADRLSIGAGGVIGNNVLNTYDTSGSLGETVVGGNTLWISFVSTSENAVAERGFVVQIEEAIPVGRKRRSIRADMTDTTETEWTYSADGLTDSLLRFKKS